LTPKEKHHLLPRWRFGLVSRQLRNFKKRKRGNELGTIPRSRFGLQKRRAFAKSGAVQLMVLR